MTQQQSLNSLRFRGEPPATPDKPLPPPPDESKPWFTLTDHRSGWQQAKSAALKTLKVIAFSWASLWGGGHAYNLGVGDGPMPTFNNIALSRHHEVHANTTKGFYLTADKATPKEWWQALGPTRQILKDLSPDVHDWFEQMYATNNLTFYASKNQPEAKQGRLAYFDVVTRKMYIDTSFLANNDGEKASIIIHEYRHSRQNPGKLIADLVSPQRLVMTHAEILARGAGKHVSPGSWTYGSILEDEAHLMEAQALQKMGLDNHLDYLADRGYHLH